MEPTDRAPDAGGASSNAASILEPLFFERVVMTTNTVTEINMTTKIANIIHSIDESLDSSSVSVVFCSELSSGTL